VSQLVEDFLAAVASEEPSAVPTPVLTRLRGSMRGVSVEDHRQRLVDEHG
jgi:hypothetical protein